MAIIVTAACGMLQVDETDRVWTSS